MPPGSRVSNDPRSAHVSSKATARAGEGGPRTTRLLSGSGSASRQQQTHRLACYIRRKWALRCRRQRRRSGGHTAACPNTAHTHTQAVRIRTETSTHPRHRPPNATPVLTRQRAQLAPHRTNTYTSTQRRESRGKAQWALGRPVGTQSHQHLTTQPNDKATVAHRVPRLPHTPHTHSATSWKCDRWLFVESTTTTMQRSEERYGVRDRKGLRHSE